MPGAAVLSSSPSWGWPGGEGPGRAGWGAGEAKGGATGRPASPGCRGWRLGRRKQWHRVGTGSGDKEAVNGTRRYQLLPSRSPVMASASVPGERIHDAEAAGTGRSLCQHRQAATQLWWD